MLQNIFKVAVTISIRTARCNYQLHLPNRICTPYCHSMKANLQINTNSYHAYKLFAVTVNSAVTFRNLKYLYFYHSTKPLNLVY